jgi:hypothetical protein
VAGGDCTVSYRSLLCAGDSACRTVTGFKGQNVGLFGLYTVQAEGVRSSETSEQTLYAV